MAPLPEQQQKFVEKYVASPPAPVGNCEVTDEMNARLLELSPEELIKADLTVGNVEALFEPENMLKLQDATYEYADTEEERQSLAVLMRQIEGPDLSGDARAKLVSDLAAALGESEKEMDTDYGRFIVLRKQQDANRAELQKKEDKKPKDEREDKSVPPLNEDQHSDFMGSRGQLMFGSVLGEAFDIHEVFAAMLSSTGGLVGPGNWLAEGIGVTAGQLDPNDPVSLHGTVHDAAGYLLNYHNDGPGYNYLGSDAEFFDTSNPLAGQMSGIAFWVNEVGTDFMMDDWDEHAAEAVDEMLIKVEGGLDDARQDVRQAIMDQLGDYEDFKDDVGDIFSFVPDPMANTFESISDAVAYGTAGAADMAVGVGNEFAKGGARVLGAATKTVGELATTAGKMKRNADETFEDAKDMVKDIGKAGLDTAGDVVGEVAETGMNMGKEAVGTVKDMGNEVVDTVQDVGNEIAETANDMADVVSKGIDEFSDAEGFVETGEAVLGTAAGLAKEAGEGLLGVAGELGEGALNTAGEAVEGVVNIVGDAAEGVVDIAGDVVDGAGAVVGAVGDMASDVGETAVEVVEDLGEAVSDIGDAIKGIFFKVEDTKTEKKKKKDDDGEDDDSSWVPESVSGALDAVGGFFWG